MSASLTLSFHCFIPKKIPPQSFALLRFLCLFKVPLPSRMSVRVMLRLLPATLTIGCFVMIYLSTSSVVASYVFAKLVALMCRIGSMLGCTVAKDRNIGMSLIRQYLATAVSIQNKAGCILCPLYPLSSKHSFQGVSNLTSTQSYPLTSLKHTNIHSKLSSLSSVVGGK